MEFGINGSQEENDSIPEIPRLFFAMIVVVGKEERTLDLQWFQGLAT